MDPFSWGFIPCRWCGHPLPVSYSRALKCPCGKHTRMEHRFTVIYGRIDNVGAVTYIGRTATLLGKRRQHYRKSAYAGSAAASLASGHVLVPLIVLGATDDGKDLERILIHGFGLLARLKGNPYYNQNDFLGARDDPELAWTADYALRNLDVQLRALWGETEYERVRASLRFVDSFQR